MPAVHKIKGLVARDSNNKGSIAQESIFERANSARFLVLILTSLKKFNFTLENYYLKFPKEQALHFFLFMPALDMQSWVAKKSIADQEYLFVLLHVL